MVNLYDCEYLLILLLILLVGILVSLNIGSLHIF